jgi:hypothetical protein
MRPCCAHRRRVRSDGGVRPASIAACRKPSLPSSLRSCLTETLLVSPASHPPLILLRLLDTAGRGLGDRDSEAVEAGRLLRRFLRARPRQMQSHQKTPSPYVVGVVFVVVVGEGGLDREVHVHVLRRREVGQERVGGYPIVDLLDMTRYLVPTPPPAPPVPSPWSPGPPAHRCGW